MDKINVNLYGGKGLFGGREKPLEADEIYCDVYNNCSFYKEGKCLRCRSWLSPTCKFGKTNIVQGYTSRAKKYSQFKNKYINDKVYNALKYPTQSAAIINDTLFMNLQFVKAYKEDGKYIIKENRFGSDGTYILLSDVTNKLLYDIFSYKPRTILDNNIIKDYADKTVPDVLQTLKRINYKIYNNFIIEYPNYNIAPNYIGKRAYVNTLVEGSILKDDRGNTFTLKHGKLYCNKYLSHWLPFNSKLATIEIDVTNDMIYKITDNAQCDENTRFE